MTLTAYLPGQVWLCAYPVRLAGTQFNARMAVIRLTSGDLILHSPCAITESLAQEISALGTVMHIIAPGNFHHLHVRSAQAAFPKATTWICPGVETRAPNLVFDEVLGDDPPSAWRGELDHALVAGRIMREVAMYHRPSRTLLVVDLIENFTDATPYTTNALKFWFKYVFRMWNRPRPAPEYWLAWGDRHAVARSLRRILAWDFERIIVSHGDLIDQQAHQAAAEAWSAILRN